MKNKSQNNKIISVKKSIESTAKAIAKNNKISVSFSEKSTEENQIQLPNIDNHTNKHNIMLIRGKADSEALIKRYHDNKIHNKNKNILSNNKELFDELENLRCESIGSKNMLGVAKNINLLISNQYISAGYNNKSKRSDVPVKEAIKMLLKEKIDTQSIPLSAKNALRPWKKLLESKCGKEITSIVNHINNQEEFSKRTMFFLKNLNLDKLDLENQPPEENDEEKNLDREEEDNSKSDNKENEESNINNELSEEKFLDEENFNQSDDANDDSTEDAGEESESFSSSWKEPKVSKKTEPYKIFNTKYDKIANAEELCDQEELIRLRLLLDKQTNKLNNAVSRLANKLQRKLMARQTRWWEFNLEEGMLDSGRLTRIITSPGNFLSYKKEAETDFKDTIVSLLIDNSGSMRGRPISIAAISTDILVKTLERCGVKVEVLGFTTRTWKGGRLRELWMQNNKPSKPGRLNELLHIIYKNADAPFRRSRKNFGLMLKEGLLKENIDGEALNWAYKRIASRPEGRKIIMVISDGAPVDDSTLSINESNYLDQHLKDSINIIEKKTSIELLAIGIGHDVSRYYKRAVTIVEAEQLGDVMAEQLSNLFDKK